jgi:diguanylate cyclase (GGDEF)-like protein
MGGDEFAILIADSGQHMIEPLAQRVISSVNEFQFSVAEFQIHVTCSMGIAISSPNARPASAPDLLRQAEIAMYQAKHFGKQRWHVNDSAHSLDLGKDSR